MFYFYLLFLGSVWWVLHAISFTVELFVGGEVKGMIDKLGLRLVDLLDEVAIESWMFGVGLIGTREGGEGGVAIVGGSMRLVHSLSVDLVAQFFTAK